VRGSKLGEELGGGAYILGHHGHTRNTRYKDHGRTRTTCGWPLSN
jgi:hypothetical protein